MKGNSTKPSSKVIHTGKGSSFWQRLCLYAQRCIEAHAAQSLVPYSGKAPCWFFHPGEEELVVGQRDSIPAPRDFAGKLNSHNGLQAGRAVIYGWPMVVAVGRDRVPKVAPLFSLHVEPEREPDGQWLLHATAEPEFNLALTTAGIFDPSVREEIDGLLGDGLPFGHTDAFAVLAKQMAGLLGLDILSPLDPRALNTRAEPREGIYNAAISVVTETSAYYVTLIQELQQLRTRKDWTATAAAHLVPGESVQPQDKQHPPDTLAAPLPCNPSQEEALHQLRNETLTIVTGPPGTGKTQLVVNAAANLWLDGGKILVTSTNNAAVNVAVERAAQDICGGLLMRTGNRTEREQMPARITAVLDEMAKHSGNRADARAKLRRAATERIKLTESLTRLDELDEQLLSVSGKLGETGESLSEATLALWADGNPPALPLTPRKIERWANRLLRAWFFRRFRTRRLYERLGCFETASLEQIAAWAQLDQRQQKLTREFKLLRDEYRNLKNAIGDPATAIRDLDEKWAQASRCAIRADTAARIRSGAPRLAVFSRSPSGGKSFGRAVKNSLESLRGWGCTALSARPNFPLEPGMFDLVIVDEASQCSLAAVLPLAYRAKRLALVGDPCQLNPIVPLGDRFLREIAEATGFNNDDLRRRGIHHKDGSAYFAFEFAAGSRPTVLLDEHYRCHPHIARWFNRAFYNDKLTVLTQVTEADRRWRTIAWKDVEGAARRPSSRRSWQNRAEAEQAVEQLGHVLESGMSVGVVTPFTAQAQLIEQLAGKRFGHSVLDEADFVCGTAHRLQGAERDAIVISAVLAPGISSNGVSWIEKERNLLNVAVSRARSTLIVLGHPAIGNLHSPTLYSLRVYLRDQVARRKESDTEPLAEFRTDSRSEELLLSAMQLEDLAPHTKLNVEGYELDFALMERGIKLNIEVDGDQHIDARGRQRRQDLTRDRVLSNLGWAVLRIPAWRCHEEIDSVINEIKTTRNRLLNKSKPHSPH